MTLLSGRWLTRSFWRHPPLQSSPAHSLPLPTPAHHIRRRTHSRYLDKFCQSPGRRLAHCLLPCPARKSSRVVERTRQLCGSAAHQVSLASNSILIGVRALTVPPYMRCASACHMPSACDNVCQNTISRRRLLLWPGTAHTRVQSDLSSTRSNMLQRSPSSG